MSLIAWCVVFVYVWAAACTSIAWSFWTKGTPVFLCVMIAALPFAALVLGLIAG